MSNLKMNYNDDFFSPERCAKLEFFAETLVTLAETGSVDSIIVVNLAEELGIVIRSNKNGNNSRHS